MKKLGLLIGMLLFCAIAYGRVPFVEPTLALRIPDAGIQQTAVEGDWILARAHYRTNVNPDDPEYDFDIWEKVVLFHRTTFGEWQLVQTLADEYLIFNSDEHYPDPHDLVLANGVAAFSTNSGLHIFERVAGSWVPRPVVGASQQEPVDLAFDGTTLLASDGSCATAAKVFTRQANGSWAAAQGELVGLAECEEYFRRELAVSGSRALVFEDAPFNGTPNDHVRVFERSGGAWLPGATLPRPSDADPYYGPALALRGDLALVGGDGTHVYRRGTAGFTHDGQVPLLVSALDPTYTHDLKIGAQLALQTYPGPSTTSDIAVLQPNSTGGFDHVATLGVAENQQSLSISGRRVVAAGGGAALVYELPLSIPPTTAAVHDFENGTQGWTAIAGQFAVAQRGATRVYRQSSLVGDTVAVNSADLEATLITADVRPTAFDGETRWVGLMARYIDENNFYYVTIRANDSISIRKKVNGVITELRTYWPPVDVGRNYRVSLEVVGNRLTFYDGYYVIQAWDYENSLPHGRAGLRTYRATAEFDNVVITPAPFMELGGGFYNSHGSMFDIVDGNWIATGASFGLDQTSTAGDARILHSPATDDQVVRVTAQVNGIGAASGSHWIGAMLRYTDASNYYYVSLRTSNELSLRKVVNGVITELARQPFTVQVGQPYRLRIEAIGTKLIVYVNDEVRLQTRDASHAQGRSGLVTYRAAASFTDYEVFQP